MWPNQHMMEKNYPKNVGYLSRWQKLPVVNNRPKGENSPNLGTLVIIDGGFAHVPPKMA
jgi:hypothetical protein